MNTGTQQEAAGPTRTAAPATSPTASRTAAEDARAGTGAGTPVAEEEISGARERIDALDARIIALVQERVAVSARIQQARIGSGGRRVHLAREMEILDHYHRALGRPGTQLAMTLLGLCRGQL